MKEIWFYDLYETHSTEALSRLLVGKFGWNLPNPGPIIAFPPNRALVLTFSETLPPGTRLAIPWTQLRLHRQIGLVQQEIRERSEAAMTTVRAVTANSKELNDTAMTVDAICACCTLVVGLGTAAVGTYKALASTEKAAAMARGLRAAGLPGGLGFFTGVKTLVGLDPGAFVGRSQAWYSVLLRHSLSLLSPSYWASFYASAKTGDWDLWKYGGQAIDDKVIQQSLRTLTGEVLQRNIQIAAMSRQSKMPFYGYRVSQSAKSYPVPTLPDLLGVAG
jgi:hypothetical protein